MCKKAARWGSFLEVGRNTKEKGSENNILVGRTSSFSWGEGKFYMRRRAAEV